MAEGVPDKRNLEISISPDVEDGVYANFAVVHHTQHEVTIDFCQLGTNPVPSGEPPAVKVVSRIHIAPTFIGPLLQAISENAFRREDVLKMYEKGDRDES